MPPPAGCLRQPPGSQLATDGGLGSQADLLVPLAQRVDRDHPFPVCRRAGRERCLERRGRTRVTCLTRGKNYGSFLEIGTVSKSCLVTLTNHVRISPTRGHCHNIRRENPPFCALPVESVSTEEEEKDSLNSLSLSLSLSRHTHTPSFLSLGHSLSQSSNLTSA